MKDFRAALTSSAALACVLSLAACGGGHPKAKMPAAPATGAELPASLTLAPLQNCPQTAILQQAQAVTLFLPGRSDIAAQVSTVRMSGISGACTQDGKHGALNVRFTVNFTANNGPADEGRSITVPWFVAITQGDRIIEKQVLQVKLAFNGNMSVATAQSKPVKIEVPDTPESAGLEILTGFKMTAAQLAYAAAHPNAGLLP